MGRKKKNRGARFEEGERAVRCQWQMKRGERVAAVTILAAFMPLQNCGNRNRKSIFLAVQWTPR